MARWETAPRFVIADESYASGQVTYPIENRLVGWMLIEGARLS